MRGTRLTHHFAPHMHEFFAIGVIDDGASRVRYRGSSESARAGALVAITAGETHTGGPDADAGWSYRMIYPHPGLFRLALDGADDRPLFKTAFIDDPTSRAAFDRTFAALESPAPDVAAEEAVLGFLRLLCRRHAAVPQRARTATTRARAVRLAREFLDAHFAERVELLRLADLCGVSPYHLVRIFRASLGVPPHAYLKQRRLAHAMSMLREGRPLATVAYACGFSDQSHLTRAFKSTYGFPPGAYRRATRT